MPTAAPSIVQAGKDMLHCWNSSSRHTKDKLVECCLRYRTNIAKRKWSSSDFFPIMRYSYSLIRTPLILDKFVKSRGNPRMEERLSCGCRCKPQALQALQNKMSGCCKTNAVCESYNTLTKCLPELSTEQHTNGLSLLYSVCTSQHCCITQ